MDIYRIDEFLGIDQSREENSLSPGMSPDACNMNTDNGGLAVAKGFVKHISGKIPGEGTIHRLFIYKRNNGIRFVCAAGDSLYAWNGSGWTAIYIYPTALANHRFDFVQAQINGVDHLIIGCGEQQIVKFDGILAKPFGTSAGQSDKSALFLRMYRSRLFAAGDPEHPNRLYWSQLPGGDRSIENWGPYSASPNVEGGHTEIGSISSDPITGLAALSNQLLIFKERSLYRLIGDKPSNFIIEEVDARTEGTAYTSAVKCADALYFMTAGGMCCFNGVTAQTVPDARRIKETLAAGDVSSSKGALCRDKLYFSMSETGGDALIEYDLIRSTYMMRRGFGVIDICSQDGALYLINSERYVYRFNEGTSYDGAPISAWWRTPCTDMRDKRRIKAPRYLYLRGRAEGGAKTLIDIDTGPIERTYGATLPGEETSVLEIKLAGEGRTIAMKLYNENGGRWALTGGVEMEFAGGRRTI